MTAIPAQSGVEVIVAAPPPPGTGKGKRIMGPMSPGGGALDSPTWLELEEEEVIPVYADMEVKAGPLAKREETRAQGDEHLDQTGDPLMLQVALVGNRERAMVLACRPSGYASGSIGEWVWPDPGRPWKARFVLHNQQEEEF